MLSSSVRAYSTGAMILHWAIAALIVIQIAAGFVMERVEGVPDALRFAMIQWHKTCGILVLALTLARIAWRLLHKPPAHAPMSRAEALAAHVVHGLFYVLMVAVPLTGWLMVSSSRISVPTLLFLQEALVWPHLPVPAGARETLSAVAGNAHTVLAYGFAGLLVLHVAGALKHSMIDRVPSLSRMAPLGRLSRMPGSVAGTFTAVVLSLGFLAGGLVAARVGEPTPSAVVASAGPTQAAVSGWVIDKAKSTLTYEIDFSGQPTAGAIGQWNAAITFDPDDLAAASATLVVEASSVTFDNAFVAPNIPGDDGLKAATDPQLTVVLDLFEKSAEGFTGKGDATIRGVTLPIEAPFTFERDAATGRAKAQGTAALDRLAFGLGVANDGAGKWLDKIIRIKFAFEATPVTAGGE